MIIFIYEILIVTEEILSPTIQIFNFLSAINTDATPARLDRR